MSNAILISKWFIMNCFPDRISPCSSVVEQYGRNQISMQFIAVVPQPLVGENYDILLNRNGVVHQKKCNGKMVHV